MPSPPSLTLGSYLPALQVGILLLPPSSKGSGRESCCLSSALLPPAQGLDAGRRSQALLLLGSPPQAPHPQQASRQLRRAGAWGPLSKRVWREGRVEDCCLTEERIPAASLTIAGGRWPGRSPGTRVALGVSRTLPILPHVVEKQGGLGKGWGRAGPGSGLGDRSRASELSCSRASNSNHPDPSVNPNLLTLTAPDKGGLTNLNLPWRPRLLSPSLPESPVAQPPGGS